MATKIQQILKSNPDTKILFGEWLSRQGLDAKSQYAYMKSGWLSRLSKGVYALQGTTPTLMQTISAYNYQLSKECIVGAYTALELRGYSHYLSMGKPQAYLFTGKDDKLPTWLTHREWDMTIKYMVTSFLGDDRKGVEPFVSDGNELLVSSPERAMLECLNLPESCWELHTNTQIRYGFLSASTGHGTSHKETYSDSPYRAETLRNQSWQPHCPARTSSPAAHSVLRLQSSH